MNNIDNDSLGRINSGKKGSRIQKLAVQWLKKQGYYCINEYQRNHGRFGGWPDFAATFKGGDHPHFFEIKSGSHTLDPHQKKVLEMLCGIGMVHLLVYEDNDPKEFIYVSDDERKETLKQLNNQLKIEACHSGYDVKLRSEIEESLKLGREDFNLWRENDPDWLNGVKKGEIFPIKAMGGARKGFKIVARCISDILDTIAFVVNTNQNTSTFYIVCDAPDIGSPRYNGVKNHIKCVKEEIKVWSNPSNLVPKGYYD